MRQFKHFLLVALVLCNIPSFAQWVPTANLTIFSEEGLKFTIILNGERYNDVPQTNIRIEELPNPYYNCKIIFEDNSIPTISKSTLMLTDANGVMQDVTYRIKRNNKGKLVLRFFSQVPARQNMPRPSNCATFRFGYPNALLGGQVPNINVNIGKGAHHRENNNNNERMDYRPTNCVIAMNTTNFEEVKRTVANNGFDETRLSTAKQIVSTNCLNTNQIIAIIQIFSFESSKLDFAKFAYDYCVDRNNYFKVSNSFSFESSKVELNNYIQSKR